MMVRDRVKLGVRIGLGYALFFSVLALIAFLIGGNEALARKGHPTIERLLFVYFVGGVTAGALGGILAPWATSHFRAAMFGAVALIPMGLTWRVMSFGFAPWTRKDTFVQLLAAILIGGGWGVITRRALVPDDRSAVK